MPIHDWTRVRSNRFHDFHQGWTIALRNALNAGVLPPGYFATAEQKAGGPEPEGDRRIRVMGGACGGLLSPQRSPEQQRDR